MNLQFLVNVDVNHTTGKFAGREELSEKVKEALEGADPQSVEGDNGGEYEVESWSVDEYQEPKPTNGSKKPVTHDDLKVALSAALRELPQADVIAVLAAEWLSMDRLDALEGTLP